MRTTFLIFLLFFAACEVPEVFSSITKVKTTNYRLYNPHGDGNINNVLIDTTSDDLDSLFTVVQ